MQVYVSSARSHNFAVQGLIALHTNPVLADSTAGLATTATGFAAIEVCSAFHVAPLGRSRLHQLLVPQRMQILQASTCLKTCAASNKISVQLPGACALMQRMPALLTLTSSQAALLCSAPSCTT